MQNKRYRLRIIIPSFPNYNIYSFIASTTTSVGPIYVGTSANKLELWDVEIIDENNCHGKFFPRDKNNKLDHYRLQQERPADVCGFYGSISSTIPRLFKLAKLYKSMGVRTVTGGKHVENFPEESLQNGIDVVVFGEGEEAIREILLAWQKELSLQSVKGIAYWDKNSIIKTKKRLLINNFESQCLPDFSLLYYAKMKLFPVNRTRGCNSHCEFCAVKDKARSCSPQKMVSNIINLVEKLGARHFFETSDHFAANRTDTIEFCKLIAKYQKQKKIKLSITVQTRITDARYPELLTAMREANIETVCIGYESPIDRELKLMKKGYLEKDLIKWTNIFHQYHFFIHGMLIFGYPSKEISSGDIGINEKIQIFKRFIKKSKIDTIQVLLPIPLPGTELYKSLDRDDRLFPLKQIGWEYYDGQYPLFQPDNKINPMELQQAIQKIMFPFYSFSNIFKIAFLFISFPVIIIFSSLTLIQGNTNMFMNLFKRWKKRLFNNYILKFSGYFIVKGWIKNNRDGVFKRQLIDVEKNINLFKEENKQL